VLSACPETGVRCAGACELPFEFSEEVDVREKWLIILAIAVGMPVWFGKDLPQPPSTASAKQSYGKNAESCPVCHMAVLCFRVGNPFRPALGHSKLQALAVRWLQFGSSPSLSLTSSVKFAPESCRSLSPHASHVKLQI
jgi:hypothetical protein